MASLSTRYIMLSLLIIGLIYGAPLDGPKGFPEKGGACPLIQLENCPLSSTLSTDCIFDWDCRGNTKCCNDGCTLSCMPPVEEYLANACTRSVDLGFLIDASSSISSIDLLNVKKIVKKVIGAFEIGDNGTHVGAIWFSDKAELAFDFKSLTGSALHKKNIFSAIDKIKSSKGNSRIDKALELATKSLYSAKGGVRSDKPKILLVMTDGLQTRKTNTSDATDFTAVPKHLKEQGVRIFSVAIGKKYSFSVFYAISSDGVFKVPDLNGPILPLDAMLDEMCKAPPAALYIHHLSGLCVAVNALSNRLYLSKSCKETFELTASKSIKHIKTGKCVVPEDTDDNSLLRLQSDCSTSLSRFQQTALFSIEHSSTGKCLHPLGGYALPIAGTDIVIYRGCDERRLNFEFFVAPPATFSIKHFGGLCVAVNASSNRLYLSKSCKEKFELTGSNYLKHTKTGKCVIPEGPGSNSFLRVQSDCSTSLLFFGQTPKLSIKHLWTRKCFHPLGGSLYPKDGTSIVIYTGCDENRLQFQFI